MGETLPGCRAPLAGTRIARWIPHAAPWILATLLAVVAPDACAGDSPLTLEQAVERATTGNPGLAELKARAEAMAAITPQQAALPDPALNFDMLNLPTRNFDLRKEDMTMLEVGVSQTIPFPGKLGLREKLAQQEALAAADSIEVARLRLVRDVKQAWWRLFFYDRALNLTEQAEKFLLELIELAQMKYRVGQGTQQDVLMAQLELSKLKDEALELAGMRRGLEAQLNALLDRKSGEMVRLPDSVEFRLPELTDSALQDRSLQASPLFARHRKMLEAAKTRVELAQKDFYPDLTIGAGYAARQNTPSGDTRSDFVNFRLSVNLPIYAAQKQARAVDQRRSEFLQEQFSLQDEHNRMHGEIAARGAEYRQAKERLSLVEHETIPQAQQTVSSLLAGYQVSKSSFSDLLRAELSLLQYQTLYWQALTRTQQILAELSAVVGEDLRE